MCRSALDGSHYNIRKTPAQVREVMVPAVLWVVRYNKAILTKISTIKTQRRHRYRFRTYSVPIYYAEYQFNARDEMPKTLILLFYFFCRATPVQRTP